MDYHSTNYTNVVAIAIAIFVTIIGILKFCFNATPMVLEILFFVFVFYLTIYIKDSLD